MAETLIQPSVIPAASAMALARAAAALARLDQALANHPLVPALLYRARLEAVRRQAAVDGRLIDPWHLAALLEGLRLRMDPALQMIERGMLFAAARHAFDLHQWLVMPDLAQQAEIQRAEACLAAGTGTAPLLAAAQGFHAWLDRGGGRAPGRAALIRYWMRHGILRAPVPLTGAAALSAETPWDIRAWVPAFLSALAEEAEAGLHLLLTLERAWFAARAACTDRRRHSRAAAAIDILAAAPMVSATSLGAGLGMAANNAAGLLDQFCAQGSVIELSHRARRRLYGLAALAPVRDGAAPPRRHQPGRGRGRPRSMAEVAPSPPEPPPLVPLAPLDRRAFDFSDIERFMAEADQAMRRAKTLLAAYAPKH